MGYKPSMEFQMRIQAVMDSGGPDAHEYADLLIWAARQMQIGNLDYHDIRRMANKAKAQA